MTIFYDTLPSPVGSITIAADDTHLRALHMEGDRYFKKIPKHWVHDPQNTILAQARKELTDYFKGNNFNFSVPIALEGTDFQKQVWRKLQRIPAGQTVSYAEIAAKINRPKAVRAVGTAVGKNPLCIIIPCHRVVSSSGGMGGYVAGVACKQYLLEHENTTL